MNLLTFIFRNLKYFLNLAHFNKTEFDGFLQNKKFKIKNFKNFKKIIFPLDDSSIIHLGDQLFFYSLAKILNQNLKIEIMISNDDDIIFFKHFNKTCIKDNNCLYISSIKYFTNHFKKFKNLNLIAIDINKFNSKLKIIDTFNKIFNKQNHFNIKNIFWDINYNNKPILNCKKKFIIINDEIFSSLPLNFSKKRKKLYLFSKLLKNKYSCLIIRIGKYPISLNFNNFIDLDLSTKLKKQEIMPFISQKSCLGVLTFDNYFMHVASIFNKKIFVLPRGRISMKDSIKILNLTVPFFDSKSEITILDKKYLNYSKELINNYNYL